MIYPTRALVVGIATLREPDPVLAPALALAERTGATLHLVHAFDPPNSAWVAAPYTGFVDGELLARYVEEVRLRMEAQVSGLGEGVRFRCHAIPGSPASAIHDVAREFDAALLLVGATRRGTVGKAILGTTAQRVMRGAPAPVLVIRGRWELPRRVLLATDLSAFSAPVHELALDVLESLFPTAAAPVFRALHVVGFAAELAPATIPDGMVGSARAELASFLAERRPRGSAVEPVVRFGYPPGEMLEEARSWGADLVVVGTHARRSVERWLLGSVAEAVTRDAPCHVLVIPSGVAERRTLPVLAEAGRFDLQQGRT